VSAAGVTRTSATRCVTVTAAVAVRPDAAAITLAPKVADSGEIVIDVVTGLGPPRN